MNVKTRKAKKQVNLKHRSIKLDEQLIAIESALHNKCREIPYAENILSISGMGRVYCPEYRQK